VGKKKTPWYPRYMADYQMDPKVKSLNMTEHGAYTLLMDNYYFHGRLTSNREQLHSMCNAHAQHEHQALDRVIDLFFQDRDGDLIQKRVEEELAEMGKIKERRKNAAKIRWDNASAEQVQSTWNANTTQHSRTQEPRTPPEGGFHALPESKEPPSEANNIRYPTSSKPTETRERRLSAIEILRYLNKTAGKGFQEVDANLEPIMARLKEGANPVQCKSVIVAQWHKWAADEKMHEFLRPETLFRKSKFWGYLGNITSTSLASESPPEIDSNGKGKP